MPTTTARDERLAQLRAAMRSAHVDACIIPSSDPHLSEYLPGRWQGREWLTGFTGSVGTFIATGDFAGCWTDARYWTQAETELAGSSVQLMKIPSGASLLHIDWLAANLAPGQTVAVDARVLGLSTARLLADALKARGIILRTDIDLLDSVWRERPALPLVPLFEHAAPYASTSRAGKLAATRAAMAALGAERHFISTLDDIAWLFNLRGADVNYNPVFLAHALVAPDGATLFVAEAKVDAALRARLQLDGVTLVPYEDAAGALAALPADTSLLIDPRRITAGMRDTIAQGVRVIEAVNPTTFAKSRKTAADAAHVRATMEQDGAALCEFFAWLEAELSNPARAPLTEVAIDRQITAARARRPGFVSPSFGTIAGFNANGAVIHYRASEAAHAVIEGDGLLLIDSGGQYLGGTTDITRVVPVGVTSEAQRSDFTLVLKGVIALSSARFPRGTRSPMLDALARAPIWAAGIDYGHGTGHGVGFFLNVHEGPQSISASAMPEPHTAMEEGMITSVEPGIYRPGRWGIRIENLVLNVALDTTEFGDWLRFETLTLCPIDTRCLHLPLLRADEIAWINDYHATVRARLAPHVGGAAAAWLDQRTQEI
ncbi:aminopeptidase P family protein [Massilia antarctica]|uniref:aminopeptidase P family protein n=1 Tax=Massilia antarctica TaxID=2765360 RepID=UPI0006BB8AEC|nr:aminopeptidase P family protein [Massilia sp. H27-R4]MCY0912091.1 aminopeptidase P family protein [Massilia sp. H27-R4]CUI06439.1 Xaa-Pro aminopeptidase [Janthinobacterium sp. CG23_2]CUU30225.1 Xaa-Pro aminopeptidase [Janthinobacterium sp. CG23_2]